MVKPIKFSLITAFPTATTADPYIRFLHVVYQNVSCNHPVTQPTTHPISSFIPEIQLK